jgi:hypothetical protein
MMAFVLLSLGCASSAAAVDHARSVGEPYALAGKRMMFTNWYYIRPGQIDWVNVEGKSVYGDTDVKAGPDEAQFRNYLAPRGVRLAAQPAERVGPILAREKPWEKMGIHGTSLMVEDGKFRLWAGSQDVEGKRFGCYFESTDGRNWIRPDLGIVEFDGNKNNNLFDCPGSYIFRDPSAPEGERYKCLWAARTDPAIIKEYRARGRPISVFAEEEDPGRFHSIRAAVSPDGFRWTELRDPLSVEVSDTQIIAYFDEQLGRYVMFTRAQELGPRAGGTTRPVGRMHDFVGRRAIGRSESKDFRAFPLSELILQCGADMAPTDTYYSNCKTTIPRAPDHHLLFPAVYHQADDTTSIEVFSSHDTRSWTKLPGSPVLKTNRPGQWDGGCVFTFPSLVELPNGDWALPYTGYVYPHKYPRGAWGYDVGLAVWRKGRLVALEAEEEGEFATVAFISPGKIARINALTDRVGRMQVEVCDIDGKTIPRRSFEDAVEITGDQHWTPLKWKGGDDLGVKAGEAVILRFRLSKAKVFGVEFD